MCTEHGSVFDLCVWVLLHKFNTEVETFLCVFFLLQWYYLKHLLYLILWKPP